MAAAKWLLIHSLRVANDSADTTCEQVHKWSGSCRNARLLEMLLQLSVCAAYTTSGKHVRSTEGTKTRPALVCFEARKWLNFTNNGTMGTCVTTSAYRETELNRFCQTLVIIES